MSDYSGVTLLSSGLYDSTYECRWCDEKFVVQTDNRLKDTVGKVHSRCKRKELEQNE